MSITSRLGFENLDPSVEETVNRHIVSALWGLAMATFGCLILKADMRKKDDVGCSLVDNVDVVGYEPYERDVIFGMEQRYFVVILHGVLLYISLTFLLAPDPVIA